MAAATPSGGSLSDPDERTRRRRQGQGLAMELAPPDAPQRVRLDTDFKVPWLPGPQRKEQGHVSHVGPSAQNSRLVACPYAAVGGVGSSGGVLSGRGKATTLSFRSSSAGRGSGLCGACERRLASLSSTIT